MLDLTEPSNNLFYTTVRLESKLKNGGNSIGTAFFFSFKLDETRRIPVLVTNKHVIDGAVTGTFLVHKGKKVGEKLEPTKESTPITVPNFDAHWICHPDGLDLCAMPFEPLRLEAQKKGVEIFFLPFGEEDIPDDSKLANLRALEDVNMIGYPIGLWDQVNNFPIVRRGMTASPPLVDFNGKPEGAIDIAAFPGSSGSPIIIFNQGSYPGKGGGLVVGGRFFFLGVLWGGPQLDAKGKIEIVTIPTSQIPVANTPVPIHVGYYIKSRALQTLKTHIVRTLGVK